MSDTIRTLVESPIFLLTLTIGAYLVGCLLRDRTDGHPLAQPVLVAVVVVIAALVLLDVDYSAYASGTELITFLLGPATVALAVPLHRQAHRLRGLWLPMLAAITAGAMVSTASAILLVRAFGGGESLALTMAPKATTTPVALALSERIGGLPPLTVAFAILAGMLGAVAGPLVLNLLRVRDPRARGLAVGAVSHGIGTSRLLHEDEVEGAFSGLSMGLTALATSLVLPLVILVLG